VGADRGLMQSGRGLVPSASVMIKDRDLGRWGATEVRRTWGTG